MTFLLLFKAIKKSLGLFLNTRTCLYLWNVISRRPSTALAKYSSNPRMCSGSAPFIEDASRSDLRQPGVPECIPHQSASGKTRKI